MSEMVERVAQAQAGFRWETFDEEQKEAARELARLALDAMRHPTEAMVEAAARGRLYGDAGGLERHDFETEYRQAIDESLR